MDNRKLLAVIVGIVVVVAAVSAAVVVLNNNRSDDSTFEYQNFYDDKQYSHKYRYSDEYFMKDSTEYDNSLATMSMCMNMASVAYIGGNYSEQCRFIEELMKKIGFENIYINDDYKNKPTEFSMGVIIGSKVIENKTLLGVFTRGGNYSMEWVSNFTIGTGEHSENMHEGFYISSDIILKCINEYLTKYDLKENIKLWMSGYSRGAAVTNIAAGRIDMDMINGVKTFDNGAKLNKADMYVYTFETPMGAPKNMDVDSEKFNNVFNIIYPYDVITHVAMSNLGFDRFGIDINIPVEGTAGYNEKLSKMLGIYNNMADGGPCVEFKINDFKMHKISNSFPYISVDKSKSDWRMNDLSKDFTRLLSKGLGDDRTIYCRDVQGPINDIFRIVFEDNPDGTCILIGQAIGTEILNVYSILELPELIDTIRNGSTDDIYNALHEAVVNAISKLQPKSVSADELTMALSKMIVSFRNVVENSEDPNALINDLVSMSVNSSFESQFMTSISPHYPPMILAWLISQDENY